MEGKEGGFARLLLPQILGEVHSETAESGHHGQRYRQYNHLGVPCQYVGGPRRCTPAPQHPPSTLVPANPNASQEVSENAISSMMPF